MKFLFILLCIFLLVRYLFKPLLKLVIQLVLNKMVNNQGTFQRTYTNTKKRSGKVDVDYVPPQPKYRPPGPKPGAGEYIDYEEVK